jgi:hypothetical protein
MRKLIVALGGTVLGIGALLVAVPALANTGNVVTNENCESWSVKVYLNDNVTLDKTVDVLSTIPGTIGINGAHYDTTKDTTPVLIWSKSGVAPASGTVTLDIYNGKTLEFTASGSIAPSANCGPSPSPKQSPSPSPEQSPSPSPKQSPSSSPEQSPSPSPSPTGGVLAATGENTPTQGLALFLVAIGLAAMIGGALAWRRRRI